MKKARKRSKSVSVILRKSPDFSCPENALPSSRRLGRPKKSKKGSLLPVKKKCLGLRAWVQTRGLLDKYLAGLTSAQEYMSEGHFTFLSRLRKYQRLRILSRLREVDPEGLKRLRIYFRRLRGAKKKQKALIEEDLLRQERLIVVSAKFEEEGISKVRFVPGQGLVGVLALLRASGYSNEEISKKMDLDPMLVSLVTPADIAKARRKLPEAIVHASDAKVMRDLINDELTPSTEMADRISARRIKIAIAAQVEGDKLKTRDEKDMEDSQTSFFGKTQDAEYKDLGTKEEGKEGEQDEDHTAGSTAQG